MLALLVRIALGTIFLMSALTKLASPGQFAGDVREYRLLPQPLATAFGWALPYAELAVAGLFLTGVRTAWAAGAAVVLLVAFMIAVGLAMLRGFDLSCSCFGLLYRERVGWGTQVRDGVLLLMALFVFSQGDSSPSVAQMVAEPGLAAHAVGLGATVAAVAGSLLVTILSVRIARRRRDTT